MLIAAAAAVVPLIAGCEAGTNAPTQNWHAPAEGTFRQVGDISISNAFILGAPIGQVMVRGQSAGLFLGVVNTGHNDTILAIAAPGTARSVTLPGGSIALRTLRPALLTGPQPAIILNGLLRPLRAGQQVTLLVLFKHAGLVRLLVQVMPWGTFYATLSQAPTPTPSVTPVLVRLHHHGSPSPTGPPSPTPSPAISPSPTASPTHT